MKLPPRIELAALPTPLTAAPRLAAAMGAGCLLVKRDDLSGFAFGGNKARPLEFLVAAAREQCADTLLTGGSAGSNFCAAAAAAARVAGLACHLVIAGEPAQRPPGLSLARSWGASVSWTHTADRASVDTVLPRVAAQLAARGQRPYVVPRGGATALGAVGYAVAAGELNDQLTGRGLQPEYVVVAVGSGGTLAGLIAGNVLLGRPWRLVGASVSRSPRQTSRRVLELASTCVRLLTAQRQDAECRDAQCRDAQCRDAQCRDAQCRDAQCRDAQCQAGRGARRGVAAAMVAGGGQEAPGPPLAPAVTDADVEIVDARGPGHGLASRDGRRAADTAMTTEGIVVDPVYTAKALQVVRRVAGQREVVFWHTGGLLDTIAAAQECQR